MVRRIAAAAVLALSAAPILAGAATLTPAKQEMTPEDAVETTRVIRSQLLTGQAAEDDFASPDGRRYLIRLIHGDVKHNGVWMDLLTGPLDSLESAAHPKRCAHLFTAALGSNFSARAGQADVDTTNTIHWFNSTEIAFLWSDTRGKRQIMSVDLVSCRARFLTHAPADIFSFAKAPSGTLLFDAQVLPTGPRADELWAKGFTVSDASDAFSLLSGYLGDETMNQSEYKNSWFVRSKGKTTLLTLDGNVFDPSNPYSRDLSIGPSGRYALVWIGTPSQPPGWNRYTNPVLLSAINSHDKIRLPVRYAVVDLHTATSHSLWSAAASTRAQVHWSPTEDRALLVPTYLPPDTDNPAGLSGNAAVDIDIKTGEYRLLPIDLTDRRLLSAKWLSSREVEIASANLNGEDIQPRRYLRVGEVWQGEAASQGSTDTEHLQAPIRLEISQSLNTPPQIFAVDTRSGERRLIVDPNPELLNTFKLGRIERMSGELPTGQRWIGQLIYPADYEPGKRYPLVIQSQYGQAFGAEEFTLDGNWGYNGMGLGPTMMPTNPGQLLATRNIAVLNVEVIHAGLGVHQAEDHRLVFEAVSRHLIDAGIADARKIALSGFSNNGYWVEYTLAHSDFPFAAAIAADNYDPSYIQSALTNWRATDEDLNGAPAFGAGLEQWLKNAPGFNAEHIHTPLLMTCHDGALILIVGKWETYSRLRHLGRPVQMYLMPGVNRHPAHTPQNPAQILGLQNTAVDWFDFWLSNREDPRPDKREQYARWHRLRAANAVVNP